jgi:hypothetical protein
VSWVAVSWAATASVDAAVTDEFSAIEDPSGLGAFQISVIAGGVPTAGGGGVHVTCWPITATDRSAVDRTEVNTRAVWFTASRSDEVELTVAALPSTAASLGAFTSSAMVGAAPASSDGRVQFTGEIGTSEPPPERGQPDGRQQRSASDSRESGPTGVPAGAVYGNGGWRTLGMLGTGTARPRHSAESAIRQVL